MEDDLNGRRSKWKTTTMEDDLNGRRPQWKMTSMEDDLNGRQSKWKTPSMEDDLKGITPLLKNILTSLEADITKRRLYKKTGRRPYSKMTLACLDCLVSQSCAELGPAQPQLV